MVRVLCFFGGSGALFLLFQNSGINKAVFYDTIRQKGGAWGAAYDRRILPWVLKNQEISLSLTGRK